MTFEIVSRQTLVDRGSKKWVQMPGTIGAWIAESDFGNADPIKATLHRAIDDGFLGYTPTKTVDALREATASWYAGEYGTAVQPEFIHPIADVLVGLETTIVDFSRPGSAVIVPTPAYMPFLSIPNVLGREIIQVPLQRTAEGWAYDLDAIDAAFAAGAGTLVLCNPHNPLGKVMTRDELHAISEIVDRHDGVVFSDEIHAPIVLADKPHIPYASISGVAANHTVTATSASKMWNMPGLKCAQLILSSKPMNERWLKVAGRRTDSASLLGIIANTVAYTEGRPWRAKALEYVRGNVAELAAQLSAQLPDARFVAPEATYLTWIDLSAYDLETALGTFFRANAGVTITDGTACGRAGEGHIRFNAALPRELLVEAISDIAAAVNSRVSTAQTETASHSL